MSSEEKIVNIENKLKGDLFENLDQLRVDQNFFEAIGVKKQITTVPVRKPSRQDFIRVHPDESYHLSTVILELKEEKENYIIAPNLRVELPDELIHKVLYTAINRQEVLFLWPIRLHDATGRLDEWNRSAHKAAQMAMHNWVRVVSNRSLGAYDILTPTGNLPDPEWPEISFQEILKTAFQDKIIEDRDHPVLKRLRGEI